MNSRNWKEGLRYKSEVDKKIQNPNRPKITPIKFVPSVMKITSKNDPDILDNKTVKKRENIRKNIGLLSKGQLNKKISEITGKPVKKNIKRNRNAKEGKKEQLSVYTSCFKENLP